LEDDDDREEVGDSEPSLGSFDRMTDQEKSYQQGGGWAGFDLDAEQDDCDWEDDDPGEAKDQPPVTNLYGAQCKSYPDCFGGCGLGCTREMEAKNQPLEMGGAA